MVVGDFFCKTSPHFANFYFDFSKKKLQRAIDCFHFCVFLTMSGIFFPVQMTHILTSYFYNIWNTNQATTNWLTIESFLPKLSVAQAVVATWEQQGDTTAVVAITSCHTFTQLCCCFNSWAGAYQGPLEKTEVPWPLNPTKAPNFVLKKMMDYVLRSCILWEPGQSKTNISNSFPEKKVCVFTDHLQSFGIIVEVLRGRVQYFAAELLDVILAFCTLLSIDFLQ